MFRYFSFRLICALVLEFWKPCWLVLGSTLGALGVNKLPKCLQTSMRKLVLEKVGSEVLRLSGCEIDSRAGGQELWVVGGSEEKR